MAEVRRFAEGTAVPAEKSRGDLEALLRKHGATEFAVYTSEDRTIFAYRLQGFMVRHVVDYPPKPARVPHVRRGQNAADAIAKVREAEWRRRWRAVLLVAKAKLELIASGGSTVEREFLADMLLANGQTMAEAMLPKVREMYETGTMPTLLLGAGGP